MKQQKNILPPGFCVDSFFIIDVNGKILALNYTAERITGILADDLAGSSFASLFTDPGKAGEMLRLVVAKGLICDFSLSFSSGMGKKEAGVTFNAFYDSERTPEAQKIFAIGSLVTKQKKSGEKKIQKIIKEITDYKYALDESSIVAITDHKGIINYVNDNFCKISKFSFEELIGQDHRVINSGYHPKEFIRNLWETISHGTIWRGELKNKAKDGTYYWVDTTIVPFLNKLGKPYQYMAIRADISARKEMEESLKKSLKEVSDYKYALDESSIVAITDTKGIIKHANRNFWEISKFSYEELIGQNHRIINSGYHTKEFIRKMWATIAHGKIWNGEIKNKANDGTYYWVDTTIIPFLDEHGEPYQYVAIGADITQRKQTKDAINLARVAKVLADQDLKVAHDRLLFHLENSPLGYIEWDDQFSINSLSKRAVEIFGWSLEEFKDHRLTGYSQVYVDDQPLVFKIAAQLINGVMGSNKIQHRNYTKDGRVIWCEWYNSVLRNDEGKVIAIMSLVEDITDRKSAEEALINNEVRFREFFDTAPDALLVIDPASGIFVDYNSNALQLLKCSGEELLKKSPENISPPFQPDGKPTREKVAAFIARTMKGGHPVFDWVILDSKGREIFCETRLNLLTSPGRTLIRASILNITEKVMLQRKLIEEKILKQQEITDAVITAQERERSFLGEELHDNINQILAVSKFQMDIAINADTLRKDSMIESRKHLKTAMEEIRKLSKSLLPPSLGAISLLDALGELIDNGLQGNKIHLVKAWEGIDESLLNEKLSLAIFRIVQEQLNNILKHAHAKTVIIGLEQENTILRLKIKDDGVGFDINKKRKGIGLKNIVSRTALFNGEVIINSTPGGGCELIVTFDTVLGVENELTFNKY